MTTIMSESFPLSTTDLLFRNFFEKSTPFKSFAEQKPNYPVDVYVREDKLYFDIACVGLEKSDLSITTEGNTLRVIYNKPTVEHNSSDIDAGTIIHKGITRKSFNLGWKISAKFDLSTITANMKNGLLTIGINMAEESKPKQVTIK